MRLKSTPRDQQGSYMDMAVLSNKTELEKWN